MSTAEQQLIKRLQTLTQASPITLSRHGWPRQQANLPVMLSTLTQAEALLGFPLPPLLKRIYHEVGNGGFGPGYGLFPLLREEDPSLRYTDALVNTYLLYHTLTPEQFATYWDEPEASHPLRAWPEYLSRICDWGCNIYSYLDCSQPECPVLRLDHNLSVRTLQLEASSFYHWLDLWLTKIAPGL